MTELALFRGVPAAEDGIGCTGLDSAKVLWREIQEMGLTGCERTVAQLFAALGGDSRGWKTSLA